MKASLGSPRSWMALGLAAGLTAMVGLAVGVDDPPAPSQPAPAEQPQPRGPRGERPGGERPAGEGRGERPQPGGRAPGQMVSVEASMKIMGRSLRTLKAQAGDATKRDENLRLVNDLQRGCVSAKGGVPEGILKNAVTEPDKAKIKDEYRKGLVSLLKKLIDLEEAIADGKGDSAKSLVEEIGKMRDSMHEKLGVKDE
ncbi:MAG: cytochrome b562 [Planctomycetota bacterium]|nr:cytochrome b562 [Planctomycetota bacterium]